MHQQSCSNSIASVSYTAADAAAKALRRRAGSWRLFCIVRQLSENKWKEAILPATIHDQKAFVRSRAPTSRQPQILRIGARMRALR
jgi:hypothetical protein